MWKAIFLTLLATAGNNIGKVMQKKGTIILPPLSFKLKVIRAYVFNRSWALGFLMDIIGAMLMLKALSEAPVSIVQPISGCGLAILSIFSHFYLKEVMNALDWIGIAFAGIGTIAVGAGGEEQTAKISFSSLPWLVFSIVLLFVVLNYWLHFHRNQRREQDLIHFEVVEEIIIGLESGILFGYIFHNCLWNLLRFFDRMASVISKMGFIFLEQGFSQLLVPICISISMCCSATGFVYQTRGLKHGRAIVVSTCAAVASIVTGVVAGLTALGESLPSAPLARLLLPFGWLLIVIGVILLVTSSRLLGILPRPVRRLLRSYLEKGHNNLRRTASVRAKDTSQSTVIHASTLHHLVTTSTKEKA